MLFSQFGENKSTGLSLCCLATVMMNTKQIKDGCKLADEGLCLLSCGLVVHHVESNNIT